MKITKIKPHFLLLNDVMFYSAYSHISAGILLISKLTIPFYSSHKDKAFGTKIITIGQCRHVGTGPVGPVLGGPLV